MNKINLHDEVAALVAERNLLRAQLAKARHHKKPYGECRVISGVPVVTTLVCFLPCTRGCGCIGHPAFPAPSDFRGERFLQNSGGSRRENAESYLEPSS
jgi:hypothetical protein